nr:PilN domain-containing protein [uncultured Desulfobulbus sp.]
MIHINLLPIREIKRRARAKSQIILSLVSFLGILVLLALVAWYQGTIIAELNNQHTNLQNEKKKYQKIVNQIKQIDKEKDLLSKRIDVIKQLKQDSSLTVHVLDEVASLTPTRRIWLKSLNQSLSNLSVNGMALDDQTIAQYMDDLEASSYIKNVHLANTKMDRYADRDLKSFSISCTVGFEKNSVSTPDKK